MRGVKKVGIYLVKRRQRGREGGHKIGKVGRHRLWKAPNEGERFSMLEYVVDNRESLLNVHGIVLLVSKSNVI